MRAFIILCLVVLTCADKLAYNYQPVDHSDSGLSFAPGGASVHESAHNRPSIGSFGSFGPSSVQDSNIQPSYGEPQVELEKEFFTFTANEDDFSQPAAANQLAGSVKQGLRVIFIKSPEARGLENAALTLAKQAVSQKTDIYVLNKQADVGDLANQINNVGKNANNRPEVHFVKYRTPEDAANAQKAIQDQYDSLGGPSVNINGGIAPVINFASQGPQAVPFVNTPGSNYLPSSVLRRLRFRF